MNKVKFSFRTIIQQHIVSDSLSEWWNPVHPFTFCFFFFVPRYLILLYLYSFCQFFFKDRTKYGFYQFFLCLLLDNRSSLLNFFLNKNVSSSSPAPSDLCHFLLNLNKSQASPTSFMQLHFWF